jgi:hypothetical protein
MQSWQMPTSLETAIDISQMDILSKSNVIPTEDNFMDVLWCQLQFHASHY